MTYKAGDKVVITGNFSDSVDEAYHCFPVGKEVEVIDQSNIGRDTGSNFWNLTDGSVEQGVDACDFRKS